MRRRTSRLVTASRSAMRLEPSATIRDIRAGCVARSPDVRLRNLMVLRRRLERAGCRDAYFDVARPLIDDADNDCCWQAMIVVGEYCRSRPERVWEVVRAYAESRDEDMRTAVAVLLLEHLLELHR